MLDILSEDLLLYITKFLYSRDVVSLRLCSKYFKNSIHFTGKIFDGKEDITYSTISIGKLNLCKYDHILSTDEIEVKYCLKCDDPHNDKIDLNSMVVINITKYKYILFSIRDMDCLKGNCTCDSKKQLFIHNPNLPKSLILNYKSKYFGSCPQYILETDYGRIKFNTELYKKENVIFTDIIIYKEINFGGKLPSIIQTSKHHWVLLKYSTKLIPILNIIRNV